MMVKTFRWAADTLTRFLQNAKTEMESYNFQSKQSTTHFKSHAARGVNSVNVYPEILN